MANIRWIKPITSFYGMKLNLRCSRNVFVNVFGAKENQFNTLDINNNISPVCSLHPNKKKSERRIKYNSKNINTSNLYNTIWLLLKITFCTVQWRTQNNFLLLYSKVSYCHQHFQQVKDANFTCWKCWWHYWHNLSLNQNKWFEKYFIIGFICRGTKHHVHIHSIPVQLGWSQIQHLFDLQPCHTLHW